MYTIHNVCVVQTQLLLKAFGIASTFPLLLKSKQSTFDSARNDRFVSLAISNIFEAQFLSVYVTSLRSSSSLSMSCSTLFSDCLLPSGHGALSEEGPVEAAEGPGDQAA